MDDITNLVNNDNVLNNIDNIDSINNVSQGEDISSKKKIKKIHLRIQQRGRKCITIVEGLPKKMNSSKVLKHIKKSRCCIGSERKNDDGDKYLKFSGDQREFIAKFFMKELKIDKSNVIIHGF